MNQDELSNVHVTAQFEYTADELREAVRSVNAHNLAKPLRRWAGWGVFGVLAIVLFVVLRWNNPNGASPPAPAPLSARFVWTDLLPWTLLVACFGYFIFYLRSILRKNSMSNSMLNCVFTLEADEERLVISEPNSRVERKWGSFSLLSQTKNLFLLYITKSLAVAVPKRIFNDRDNELFWDLASRRVSPKVSAFPVVR